VKRRTLEAEWPLLKERGGVEERRTGVRAKRAFSESASVASGCVHHEWLRWPQWLARRGLQRAPGGALRPDATGYLVQVSASERTKARKDPRPPAMRRNHHRATLIPAAELLLSEGSTSPSRLGDQGLSRARRQGCIREARRLAEATAHCRATASVARCQRKLPLAYCFRREPQRLRNVLPFQIRIQSENFVHAHPLRHHLDHHGYWNAQPANTGSPTQLICADSDPGKRHVKTLARGNSGDSGGEAASPPKNQHDHRFSARRVQALVAKTGATWHGSARAATGLMDASLLEIAVRATWRPH
jgi:hypothetical protein